ncbi:conserved hypothetical protein [Burkholderia pseudomallei 668]|nr:conserved hypothetical protein [Burkholderia pseudomallei 668]KGD31644.1 hypothetical protein DP59_5871 [Burkholderia pseudomallei]
MPLRIDARAIGESQLVSFWNELVSLYQLPGEFRAPRIHSGPVSARADARRARGRNDENPRKNR